MNARLDKLRNELDVLLHKQHYGNIKYDQWLATHLPFHWFAEFYEIVAGKSGFDVVIGNPPYVEWKDIKSYDVVKGMYTCRDTGNMYSSVCERAYSLLGSTSKFGMIVPLSCIATNRMASLRNLWKTYSSTTYISNYSGDAHPSVLFNGVKFRLSIILHDFNSANYTLFSTHFYRWYPEGRDALFSMLSYNRVSASIIRNGLVPKIVSLLQLSILEKLCTSKRQLAFYIRDEEKYRVFCHRIVAHFVKALNFVPFFRSERDGEKKSEDYKVYAVSTKADHDSLVSLLNSNLFYSWFVSYSDVYHCGKDIIIDFPSELDVISNALGEAFSKSSNSLMKHLRSNALRREIPYKATGIVEYDEFYPKQSKPIIDQIDCLLAQHYGFTHEEVDFIINYDIKYRMGKELDSGEDDCNE